MACSVPHTYDEIKVMVEKQIEEDKARQLAIMNLSVEYDNASRAKDDMRKAYKECNHIPQETRALIDTFFKEGSNKDYEMHNYFSQTYIGGLSSQTHEICDVYLTEKELHQLHLDEEALREILEEEAKGEKEQEKKIWEKQVDDGEYYLQFEVKYDSEYKSD
ncbi:hypothetical protein Tco_1440085 [Tanacetum coccineum]